MVTRKRKGVKITNKTRRNIKRLRNIDSSEEGIRASRQALIDNQERSKAVLDRKAKEAAASVRSGSKAIARMSADPEVQKEFAITVEKVGDAIAAVAENSGEIALETAKKMGPAAQQYLLTANELIRNSLVNGIASLFGAVPLVGDAIDAAIEQANYTGQSVTDWAATTITAVPDAVDIADNAVEAAEQSMAVISNTQEQVNKLAGAINNVANAIEKEAATGSKGKKTSKKLQSPTTKSRQNGGKTRRKKRRKKGTKKKARRRKH